MWIIKNRVQVLNPVTKKWVKMDTLHGGIIGHKKDGKPYKHIKTIDEYRETHPTTTELMKIPVFFDDITIKYARAFIKCDCGHYARQHWNTQGWCDKCGCTWYYPNYKWIMKKRREAYAEKGGKE